MKKHLLQRHERDHQLAISERREPLLAIDENAVKRRRDGGGAASAAAASLPVLVHVVADIELREFVRRWHKAPTWAFSFVLAHQANDDDDAATVRGIAICFVDDLTTVQYVPFDGNRSSIVQLVDQQVRAPSFQPSFFQLWRRRRCLRRATARIASLAK